LIELASVTSMLMLMIFATVNLSLIVIKEKDPSKQGRFEVPKVVPYIALGTSLMLLFVQLKTTV
jgi:amino acid transporter